jgi:hypothetical protein
MPRGELRKRWFASTYGYTEPEIEDLSLNAWIWWPLIEEAEAEATRRRQEQEAKAQRHHR